MYSNPQKGNGPDGADHDTLHQDVINWESVRGWYHIQGHHLRARALVLVDAAGAGWSCGRSPGRDSASSTSAMVCRRGDRARWQL